MIRANLQLTDYDATERPRVEQLVCHAAALSQVLTDELDGAATALSLTSEEILIAALGRSVQRTIGEGNIAVDVARRHDSSYPVALACAGPDEVTANDMLASVHDSLVTLTARPMARPVSGDPNTHPVADVLFAHGLPMARPAGFGHFLEIHVHRDGAVLRLDWWYDPSSFEAYTIEELAEQLAYGMIELTSEATPTMMATSKLAAAI